MPRPSRPSPSGRSSAANHARTRSRLLIAIPVPSRAAPGGGPAGRPTRNVPAATGAVATASCTRAPNRVLQLAVPVRFRLSPPLIRQLTALERDPDRHSVQ
ncbi:hypothetical protein GCM10009853_021930 [Glycomyces scopariae]